MQQGHHDYYSRLGVSRDATPRELRRAFTQLAQMCHPDKGFDVERGELDCVHVQHSSKEFQQVREAYNVLADPTTRLIYDCFGLFADLVDSGVFAAPASPSSSAGLAGMAMPGFSHSAPQSNTTSGGCCPHQPAAATGPSGAYWHSTGEDRSMPDFYSTASSSASPSGPAPPTTFSAPVPRVVLPAPVGMAPSACGAPSSPCSSTSLTAGHKRRALDAAQNVQVRLGLTLEEMYSGCVKELRVTRHVVLQDHSGLADKDELFRIEVKPGWRDGMRVTFPGKGMELPGLDAGDLVFVVVQETHSCYKRCGNDLVTRVKVPLAEALAGGSVSLLSLDGRKLAVPLGPAVLSPRCRRVLRGEGMPIASARAAPGSRGDLHVLFEVEVPPNVKLPMGVVPAQPVGAPQLPMATPAGGDSGEGDGAGDGAFA